MLSKLENIIGYNFNELELLERALTHSSCDIKINSKVYDNERLEFLGDRVLGLIIAEKFFHENSEDREGMLAKRHTSLVRKETLTIIANKWKLHDFIRLSDGEKKSGGLEKPSILSDAVEAILAAIYLDSNFEKVKKVVLKHWDNIEIPEPLKDAKSRLQEWLQKNKKPLPVYNLKDKLGDAHNATFIIEVVTEGFGTAIGKGTSKQQAEQNAANNLLINIEKDSNDR